MAEDETNVSTNSTASTSCSPGVSSYQIRHFMSPTGLQLANNAVVLPVQTGAMSQGNNVQIPKAGVPLLGASTVSGQLTFQAPIVTQSVAAAFQQAIPVSQSIPVSTTAVVGQQITLQKGQQVTFQRGQPVALQRFQTKDSLPSTPSNVSAAVGQEVILQKGQQVTLQRGLGRPVTLQRFQSKGQPIAVQRFPAVLPTSIHRGGVPSNQAKAQLGKPAFATQANSNIQLTTKPLTAIPANQTNLMRFTNSGNQPFTVQRIINPVIAQQNPGVASSPQIVTNTVSQGVAVSIHNNESLPVGTATILPGQISIQPRPVGTMVAGPVSAPITLTVTSISPVVSPVISSSTSSAAVPVIAHTSSSTQLQQQQQQTLIQRPGVVISQPSVIRAAGIPVVLPRSALSLGGRQQVLQGTLQRLIHRPLVSPTGNCGGQVTVQIPHIVGPLIKMPNFKQPAPSTLVAPISSKENISQNMPSSVSSSTAVSMLTTTSSITAISTATTQALGADPTYVVSNSVPSTVALIASSDASQPAITLTTLSENCQASCGASYQGQEASTTCILSSGVQSDTESPLSSNPEGTEGKEDSNHHNSAENTDEATTPATHTNKEGDVLSTGANEMPNNISILPNTLATLRNHKNNLATSLNKDGFAKDENKQAPGTILMEGSIDSNLLDWEDSIGTLPGTDMKFKVNEFGILELVEEVDNETPSAISNFECNDEQNENDELGQDDEGNFDDAEDEEDGIDDKEQDDVSSAVSDPAELTERDNDPICCCVYCGRYGYKSDFRTSGRFCSRTCAGKKNMHRKEMLMSRMLQGSKNKKKNITTIGDVGNAALDEDSNDKNHCSFDWDEYLATTGAVGAPKRLFKEPFPTARNGFKLAMRLEGVDPKHQALICVLSVAEIKGFRLRLHFDGYSECYDFWVNADSPFIFPVGWAEKNGKTLQPPKNMPISEFNWTSYLKETRAVAAPKHLFQNQPTSVTPSAFRVGMKLEAKDFRNSDLYCAASVADTLGDRVLIHFDGWEDLYDFWCEINSPNIRPVGWCHQNRKKLSAPPDYGDAENFDWNNYLADTKSTAVPPRAFKCRSAVGFETGLKLEVTDRRNPILVRVATVKKVRNSRLLIHFDGWGDEYDYWIDDDNCDLHPPLWCTKTFHALEPPIDKAVLGKEENIGGCPTIGCKGIGHIKGAKYTGHHSDFGCPYSAINMSKDSCLADRLGSSRSEEGGAVLIRHDYHGDIRRCPTPGCNGLGHVTGKFTSHHCVSGCPLAEKNMQKAKEAALESRPVGRPARGRKRKIFGISNYGSLEKYVKTEPFDGDDENNMFRASIHESVFQSMSAYPPLRDQPLGWSDHTKLLPGVFSVDSTTVDKWSADQVADFIQTLTGNELQAQRFKDEEIDGDSFLLLQQSDLVNFLNIKLGPAVKIFNSIQILRAGLENV